MNIRIKKKVWKLTEFGRAQQFLMNSIFMKKQEFKKPIPFVYPQCGAGGFNIASELTCEEFYFDLKDYSHE